MFGQKFQTSCNGAKKTPLSAYSDPALHTISPFSLCIFPRILKTAFVKAISRKSKISQVELNMITKAAKYIWIEIDYSADELRVKTSFKVCFLLVKSDLHKML